MENNNNQQQNNNSNNNPETGDRTFTQEDVNRIVSERLSRERDKRTAELDEREKKLRQRELAVIAREKLEEAGLNKELCNVLRYDDEAEIDTAISQLKNIKGFAGYNNADKGGKKIIENKLPEGDHNVSVDKIRDAFRYNMP